jgi:membrane protein DedA with SNARE-associated domain
VPADTAVALGAFLAARGAPISVWAVFLVTWAANVTTAVGMFYVAKSVGRPFVESRTGRRLLSPRALGRLERAYQRHHTWGIFVSRFLPGYRAVVPPFAAVAGIKPSKALPPVVLASGLYYAILVFLASRVGRNWEAVRDLLSQVGVVLLALALAATAVLVWWLRRRRT